MNHPSSRPSLPATAFEAFRRLVSRQLEILQKTEAGVADGADIEDLHDYRVAVRRIRALVGQMKKALPGELHARWRSEFAWLGRATGPSRDLDVQRARLLDYFAAIGGHDEAVLAPVLRAVDAHRGAARAEMAVQLASSRHAALVAEIRAFLKLETVDGLDDDHGGPTIDLARRRLRKIWKRFRRAVKRLEPETPDAELHRLRILGKKIRYVLEFFHPLFPPLAVDPLVAALKKCQDVLGDIQDSVVHAAQLEAVSRELWSDELPGPDSLLVIGRILHHLHVRRLALREAVPAAAGEVLAQEVGLELILEGD